MIIFLLIYPAWAGAQENWRNLAPGMEVCQISANTPSGSGSPNLQVLRIDPARYRFQVLYDPPNNFTAATWREESRALLVCNIGQYDKNLHSLGLLVKDGIVYSPLVANQQGLFLAETDDPSLPPARILDMRYSAFDEKHNPYLQAAQSLMLLDRYGQIRVRQSNRLAHRTLLGQDDNGNIIIMISEGRHTLWELAQYLSGVGWLRELMCMDGGSEAQLAIKVNDYSYERYGAPQSLPDLPWPAAKLPMALAIFAR